MIWEGQMADDQSVKALMTGYRYAIGIGVPICTLVIGVLGKKIARGPGWKKEDFFVAPELTLAGFSGALVNVFDLLKPERVIAIREKILIGGNIGIAVLGLIFFYVVLSLHQDFGPNSGKSTNKQLFSLLCVSNVVGLATLIGALLLMAP